MMLTRHIYFWLGLGLFCMQLQAQTASNQRFERPLPLPDFKTAAWHTKVVYADSTQTQKLHAEIRIQKDSAIWVSIRYLGLTMAKALLTPNEVAYVDKYNGQYYRGGYIFLSRWLGISLDYQMVQSLLLGQPLTELPLGQWCSGNTGICKVEWPWQQALMRVQWDTASGCLTQQQLQNAYTRQLFSAMYTTWSASAMGKQLQQWSIEAKQPQHYSRIELEYDVMTWNENLRFPFSIPDDYTPITID